MAFLDDAGLVKLWQHIQTRLSNKVDKVAGKGLSSNDFTDEDKERLAFLKESAQPDWNVNDENDPAYVKNRTHYAIGNVLYDVEIYITQQEGTRAYDFIDGLIPFESDKVYTIIWDGVNYECTSWGDNNIIIGNYAIVGNPDNFENSIQSDAPFVILVSESTFLQIFGDEGKHTLKIIDGVEEIKQLDEKYISDTIARVEDMILPGEETTTETIGSMDIHVDTADTAYDSEKLGGVLAEEYALKSDLESINVSSTVVLKRMQATVPANGWVQQSTGRYTQTIQVSDLTSHSVCHHADVNMSGVTEETAADIKQAWSMIDNIEATDAGVVFTSFTEAPQVDFNVYIDIEEFIETVPNANGVIF